MHDHSHGDGRSKQNACCVFCKWRCIQTLLWGLECKDKNGGVNKDVSGCWYVHTYSHRDMHLYRYIHSCMHAETHAYTSQPYAYRHTSSFFSFLSNVSLLGHQAVPHRSRHVAMCVGTWWWYAETRTCMCAWKLVACMRVRVCLFMCIRLHAHDLQKLLCGQDESECGQRVFT